MKRIVASLLVCSLFVGCAARVTRDSIEVGPAPSQPTYTPPPATDSGATDPAGNGATYSPPWYAAALAAWKDSPRAWWLWCRGAMMNAKRDHPAAQGENPKAAGTIERAEAHFKYGE